MEPGEESEPITDDEILYRRVPASMNWCDLKAVPVLSQEAFGPRKEDTTGLSLYRARYKTIEEAARGRSKKGYYIAVLRAGDLRKRGIDVKPAPLQDDPGHCEIRELNFANAESDRAKEWKLLLAGELCLRVEGPFSSKPGPT